MRPHRAIGENLAAIASLVFYVGLTFFVLFPRRRWLVYLFFVALVASLLFSTGAFVLLRFGKW